MRGSGTSAIGRGHLYIQHGQQCWHRYYLRDSSALFLLVYILGEKAGCQEAGLNFFFLQMSIFFLSCGPDAFSFPQI